MSPRVLRELSINPDETLPDNVVQVIQVLDRYHVSTRGSEKLYRWRILAVVEEEASEE